MVGERRPSKEELYPLLSRAIKLTGTQLAPDTIRAVAEVFSVFLWHFVDYDLKAYFVIGDAGDLSFVLQAPGEVDGTVKLEAAVLHDIALGRTPVAMAFLSGKLRLQGLPALKLRRFIPLLQPFLDGYRQAWQEIGEG